MWEGLWSCVWPSCLLVLLRCLLDASYVTLPPVSVPIGLSISMAPSLLFAHNLLQVFSNSVCSCCWQSEVLYDVLINEGMCMNKSLVHSNG
jgi:hypothetical protein